MAVEPTFTKAMERAVNPAAKLLAKAIVDEVKAGTLEPTNVYDMSLEAVEETPQYDRLMWPLLESDDEWEEERQEIWHDWTDLVRRKAHALAEKELGISIS